MGDPAGGLWAGDRTQRVKEQVRLGVLKVISSAYDLPMSPWEF